MKGFLVALAVAVVLCFTPSAVIAQPQALSVKPLAEKKVTELPPGDLFWRIENFSSLAEAQAAAGPHSLATEAAGRAWLFTLGPKGGVPKGTKVTEFGPIPRPTRHADAGLEQRHDRPAFARHVRGGRHQAVFVSGQDAVS